MDVYVMWISSGNNWLWQRRLKCFCLYCKARNYNKFVIILCWLLSRVVLTIIRMQREFPFFEGIGLLPEFLPKYLWLEASRITFLSSIQVNTVKDSGNYVLPPEWTLKILDTFPHSEFIPRNFYSAQQHLLACIYNGGTVLLLWSRNWIFNYSLD